MVSSLQNEINLWIDDMVAKELQEVLDRALLQPIPVFAESGLGKHMGHIHENRGLKFSEILQIFKQATEGTLESVSEKLDGQNMFFTYNVGVGELKFGRNKGMIKAGGIDAQGIATKWEKLPNVKDAFFNAYNTLNKALAGVDPETLTSIFGPRGDIWFSIEVVSTFNPNVIEYNQNVIVFHKVSLVINEEGKVVNNENFQREFAFLDSIVGDLQKNVADSKWKIMGPLVMQLKKATSNDLAAKHGQALMAVVSKYGLSPENTIGDYLAARWTENMAKSMDAETADRLGKIFGHPDLTPGQRKKEAEKVVGRELANAHFKVSGQQKTENGLVLPLEKVIYDFAVDVLSGVHSAIALNPDEEVKRMQGAVKKQVELIKNSGEGDAMATMSRALKKLQSVDRITSSMEGIVFKFGDRTYKLTGTFSPVNQILGLFRF